VNNALMHPWLYEARHEPQYDGYSSFSTLPNPTPDNGKSHDLTASSSFVSSDRPRTPSPNPRSVDDCSQDFHNLRLNTSSVDGMNGKFSTDSISVDTQNLASEFPSVPDINMGYPESTSSLSAMNISDMPALQSAWMQKPPPTSGNETIMAIAKQRSPSPSAASSSPLSSVPSEDESARPRSALPRNSPKKAKAKATTRRVSTRIKSSLSAMSPVTPPPTRKRRRLSNESPGAGPSSGREGPRRHSSGDTSGPAASASPETLTPRRSVRATRKTKRFQ